MIQLLQKEKYIMIFLTKEVCQKNEIIISIEHFLSIKQLLLSLEYNYIHSNNIFININKKNYES